MRAAFSLLLLLALVGGCRFLSSDDEEEPLYFDVIYRDVESEGAGAGTIEDGTLILRGEYLHTDSTTRYVELTLPGFSGERAYALERENGIYGAIDDGEDEPLGYSSGHRDDVVRIDNYDEREDVVLGAFFFHGTAYGDFDGIPAFFAFRIAGRFRTELN